MILECAECHMRYLVPDSAIGAEGRLVRCANCKHSWHQPAPDRLEETPADAVAPPTVVAPSIVAPPSYVEGLARAPEPSRPPRRNPARARTTAAISGGLALLAACVALLFVDTPSLLAQIGMNLSPQQTPLLFATNSSIDRHDLPSGNEYFAVKGAVINPTGEHQHVPDIRVLLKDAHNRTVYSWSFQPATRDIGPKGSLPFDSAMIDVPANSTNLVLTFSDEG